MSDFQISGFDFSATSISVAANTAAARDWFARHIGAGVVSSTFRKSSAGDVLESIQKAGLTVEKVAA